MEKPKGQEARDRRTSPNPRAAKEDWWSLPTPNRQTVAYHLGRLLNQLRWHLQRSLFFVSKRDEEMANAVLDRILVVSFRLAEKPESAIEATIRRVRREWADEVFSEHVADEIAGFSADEDERIRFSQSMTQRWVEPVIGTIQHAVWKNLDSQETWLFRLGERLDQSIRRPDAYRFMYRTAVDDPDDLSEVMEVGDDNCDERREVLVNYLPEQGSLPVDSSWVQEIRELFTKAGLANQDVTRIRQELQGQTDEELVEHFPQIDEAIRRAIGEDTGIRATKPRWDVDQRELWVGNQMVRRYRHSAPNQTRILESFESDDWPSRIDTPLPAKVDVYQTLRQLNLGIEPKLIRFMADGTKSGIIWKYAAQQTSDQV